MHIIYVRGGDKSAPDIAFRSGMLYGTRNDYKAYASVFMIDIQWKRYIWHKYLTCVESYAPVLAMAPDYLDSGQKALLYSQIADLERLGVPEIMVCPKFEGAVFDIPERCIVAISVPSNYAGYLPDFRHLRGRRVHLLGGKPELQAKIIVRLTGAGAHVFSVDGSYHAVKAGFGQWFNGHKWVDVRRRGVSSAELAVASGCNIVKYLNAAYERSQPSLGLE